MVACAVCTALEVNHTCQRLHLMHASFSYSQPQSHQQSSQNLWKHQQLGLGNRKVIFFFPQCVTDGGKAFVMLI